MEAASNDSALPRPRASFRETSAVQRTVEVPLAHLSVELGHFYPEDFREGEAGLVRYFRRIAPWVRRSRLAALAGVPEGRARVSTCLLIDDYSQRRELPPPSTVVPAILAAAAVSGLTIDYLARESACAEDGRIPLAPMVEKALVPDPSYGMNGLRPPVHDNGWLCNGSRSPVAVGTPAMAGAMSWKAPLENGPRPHSVFLDVELWGKEDPKWSCAFLAAVWQLLRMGLLRVRGESVANPVPIDLDDLPTSWSEFPEIARIAATPHAFSAYRTFSVLDTRYLPIEHAVRVILGQIGTDQAALESSIRRAENEGVELPAEAADRICYLLLGR